MATPGDGAEPVPALEMVAFDGLRLIKKGEGFTLIRGVRGDGQSLRCGHDVSSPFSLAGLILVAVIAFVTLSPIGMRPVTAAPADMERFLAFAALGVAFCIGYPRHRVGIILIVIAATGLLELGQHVAPAAMAASTMRFSKQPERFSGSRSPSRWTGARKRTEKRPFGGRGQDQRMNWST